MCVRVRACACTLACAWPVLPLVHLVDVKNVKGVSKVAVAVQQSENDRSQRRPASPGPSHFPVGPKPAFSHQLFCVYIICVLCQGSNSGVPACGICV